MDNKIEYIHIIQNMSIFLFAELPFFVKGHVLSFMEDNYVFRKGRTNEVFMCRISREKMAEMKILFEKNARVMTWKRGDIWRSYIEFSSVSPIRKIIRKNFEYIEDDDSQVLTPEIHCYYEKNYYTSAHIYQTPIRY